MFVNGCDCSIVIKTAHREVDIPYADETLREAVSFLQEEAAIEGDGVCRGIRKPGGVTGCVVTPLTINTAPLLLMLAMGSSGRPFFVSETRGLFRFSLNLVPAEDTGFFDLIQDRSMRNEKLGMSNERRLYEGCRVLGFELRVMRGEAVKLKLDIYGYWPPREYPYSDTFERAEGERFNGDCVCYQINGREYNNIYGITIVSKKIGGTKTELWIKRVKEQGPDIPELIEDITFTAQLLRDKYEFRHFGTFRITVKRLVLINDNTEINASDAVIGPLRYYVAGSVSAEVFSCGEEIQ